MANIPPVALGLWALSIIAQLAVLTLLLLKGHFRGLPLFTIYIILNLCQAGLLIIVYSRLIFASHDAQVLFWFSEAITLIAQAFAATEILHHVLRPYRGIWALAWRLLAITSSAVVLYVAASAKEDPDWILMIASRGFHLTFTIATVSCLLLIRFYEIPVHRVYKALLTGFCLFSCSIVIADTLLPILRARHNMHYAAIWNSLALAVFVVVQIVWTVALREPLTVPRDLAVLPATYARISPEINLRLRALNEVLCKFWKLEAPRS
jgi:hypothetical protein